MNNSNQKCILNEVSQTLESKTNSFRERIHCNRNMKYVLTLESRILCKLKIGLLQKKMHFLQIRTILFTEILHKYKEIILLKFGTCVYEFA